MSYECHVILDLEFNPAKKEYRRYLREEIVEIGAVKLNPQMEEIGRFSCLVRPELNDGIDPEITKLTGLRSTDVINAVSFAEALRLLSEWVGPARARIYSWSDNDLRQLCLECEAKEVYFPQNLYRWMDLQKVFQRLIHYPRRLCMALSMALELMGIPFSRESAHRALYDAEVTAELLRLMESAEFRAKQRKAHETFITGETRSTHTIASACGDKLAALLAEMSVA